jgi:hypothetical protein
VFLSRANPTYMTKVGTCREFGKARFEFLKADDLKRCAAFTLRFDEGSIGFKLERLCLHVLLQSSSLPVAEQRFDVRHLPTDGCSTIVDR